MKVSVAPLPLGASRFKRRRPLHPKPPTSFLGVVMQALHPNQCIKACHGRHASTLEDICLDDVIPAILKSLESPDKTEQVEALDDLLKLVDKDHAQNRIPLVCTKKFDVVEVLGRYVASTHEEGTGRRQACLVLNNLSIPFDNKAVMVLGKSKDLLLSALLNVIRNGYPEAYLCCVCLMNLSVLEDAKEVLIDFQPSERALSKPLANPYSLVSTLETMMKRNKPFLLASVLSVEGEAIRWAVGMFRNLCTTAHTALMVAQTNVPSLVSEFLEKSPQPLAKWTRDSLEDMSLALLVQLVHFPASRNAMRRGSAKFVVASLTSLTETKGIHGMRASMICQHLQTPENVHRAMI